MMKTVSSSLKTTFTNTAVTPAGCNGVILMLQFLAVVRQRILGVVGNFYT